MRTCLACFPRWRNVFDKTYSTRRGNLRERPSADAALTGQTKRTRNDAEVSSRRDADLQRKVHNGGDRINGIGVLLLSDPFMPDG